jgi:hypothetical protein
MSGFIQGEDRSQATLFPERLDDYVAGDSAVRVIDVFIDDHLPQRKEGPKQAPQLSTDIPRLYTDCRQD